MLGLVLILVTGIQFEGTSGEEVRLYHKAGDDVVLPCNSRSSSYSCSIVSWLYSPDRPTRFSTEVVNGKVVQSSPRAARLNVDTNCSLIINNITAADAGEYTCRLGSSNFLDGDVYLSVLTISPSPPDADPRKEDVTLACSLWRHSWLGSCPENSFRWLDERGTELTGEDVGYKLREPSRCVSSLNVQHQSGTRRRFTCQFFVENSLKAEAHYTPVFEVPVEGSLLSFIMLTLRISGLILMVGITVGIIRTRGIKKPQKDISVHYAVDDDTVSYENYGEHSAAALS